MSWSYHSAQSRPEIVTPEFVRTTPIEIEAPIYAIITRGLKAGVLSRPHIDAVPFVAIEGEAGDGQRFALSVGFLHPVIDAAGGVAAIAYF